MNGLAQQVAQRNDRLQSQAAPLAYSLGDEALALDGPTTDEVTFDDEQMSATFVVAAPVMDREGDVVDPAGIDVTHWGNNPVWLWDHDTSDLPIGTGMGPNGELGWKVVRGKAYATCWFDREDERSRKIYGAVKRGILKGTSIGFLGKTGRRVKTGLDGIDDPRTGWQFDTSELLEISLVCVPMNRAACEVTKSLNLSQSPRLRLADWRGKAMPMDEDQDYRTTAVDTPDDTPEGYEDEPVMDDMAGDMGDEMAEGDMPEADAESEPEPEGLPGARSLQAISAGASDLLAQANDLLGQNENPKVVKAIQRVIADLQDMAEAMDTLHGQEYGGGDEETPPPEPEAEGDSEGGDAEEKGADGDSDEDAEDDEDDEERKKSWKGRVSRLKGWLDRKGLATSEGAALTKRVATLEAELKAAHEEWGRIKGLVYRHTGLPAAKPQTRAVARG